ncbi:DUF2059 domain-containing protein [Phenylobacterium sp.]|jgi:hypothetical protein|uniref:DUF2059 domain-containing protein n=1 Tax=Phenylobacterium sp. TaxID=1871053 RepID=UPI002F9266B2
MFLKTVSALGCAAVLAFGAGAADAAPTAKQVELARRYMAALHMEEMMGSMMQNLAPAMLDNIAKRSGGQVPPELRKAFTEASAESMQAMTPRMVEVMVPAIADTFTEAELQAAVAYYESPLAKSLLAKTGAYMAKVQPAITRLMPEMQADLEGRLCRKIECPK